MKIFTKILLLIVLVVGGYFLAKGSSVESTEVPVEASVTDAIEDITENNMATHTAILKTNKGEIEIELWGELAPKTVDNFVTLSKEDFYSGVRFHRIIEGFMIQGGDPLSKDEANMDRWGTGGPGYIFEDEIHAENKNDSGTISMANAGPNTNGSQFFINVADNNFLDEKHTVFGKVSKGYEIVEEISKASTDLNDRPIEEVVIESVEIK